MRAREITLLRNLPLKALVVFNAAARHLNLVRAGKELHLTQGALSRQLKSLEEHLGVELFRRGPRGLSFTQDGELLYDYSKRAFETLSMGLRNLSVVADRETLVISVARSFAIRVLASRIARFVEAYPEIDVHVDVHRYFVDLESSGADISIRLGPGEGDGHRVQVLSGDAVWPVANAHVAARLSAGSSTTPKTLLLRYSERDYWDDWLAAGHEAPAIDDFSSLQFNDSATMLDAVQAGAGFCLTRASLVRDAVTAGALVRLGEAEMHDGLRYYAIGAARSSAKKAVDLFMGWLEAEVAAPDAHAAPPRGGMR